MIIHVVENTMGQGIVAVALKNLGGKASKADLQKELKRLGASESLYTTSILNDRLNKMRKRYEVTYDAKAGLWCLA